MCIIVYTWKFMRYIHLKQHMKTTNYYKFHDYDHHYYYCKKTNEIFQNLNYNKVNYTIGLIFFIIKSTCVFCISSLILNTHCVIIITKREFHCASI